MLKIPYLGVGLLILVFSFWLGRKGGKLVEESWIRSSHHRNTAKFLGRFTFFFTFVLGLGISLQIIGLNANIFIGGITFAIGFGLRNWFANLLAGMIIVSTKIFDIKSFIQPAGGMGSVLDIDSAATTLKTITNQTVRIPNSLVISKPIVIMGLYPEKLIKLEVSLSTEYDPMRVIKILEKIVFQKEEVSHQPEEPMVLLNDLTDGYMNFIIRYWVPGKMIKGGLVKYKAAMNKLIYDKLEEAGIVMSYAVQTLNINQHDSAMLTGKKIALPLKI